MVDDIKTKDQNCSKTDQIILSKRIPWLIVVASIVFSIAAFEMFNLYGIVHWKIMFPQTRMGEHPSDAVFSVLDHLGLLRLIFTLLAIIWAIGSFRVCPRWASMIALLLSLAALMAIFLIT